ncbi:hypothetical protein V6N13_080282 [Hibiscus sabdariffa]|uniref:Uncharacterized protein n=2 Tax=Hibiscus sabdariffa TaxID=183260 RepID=A0ABR1Z7F8_9ROSI
MVNSLSGLGLPYNTTAENRRLAIELAGLTGDGFNSTSTNADPKRLVESSTFPEDPSKRVKVEPGLQSFCVMSPDATSSIPNIETARSAGHPDEEFKPNVAMEEMIINFLIRVRLLLIVLLCSA